MYYALEQQKKVIPLILVDSKTPFRLMRLQHIDFTKNYSVGLLSLLNELKGINAEPLLEELERKTMVNAEPFYKKYAGLLIGLLTLLILAVTIFLFMQTEHKPTANELVISPALNDTVQKSREDQTKTIVDTSKRMPLVIPLM